MNRIKRWWIRHRFRKAIMTLEQEIKESQEFIEFCDVNLGILFKDENDWPHWAVSKSKMIENIDALIAELAQIDQIQAKYRKTERR